MRDAVIVAAVRTPVGRRGGVLAGVHPVDLSATVLRALVDRTGIDPGLVDDVIWGCVSQVGEQTFNVGRSAVLAAGWPESVPATTVDRQCGSSQQAVAFAAAGLIAGQYDVVVAGGVEVMSRVALGSSASVAGLPFGETVLARYADELAQAGTPIFNQGVSGVNPASSSTRSRFGLTSGQLGPSTKDGSRGRSCLFRCRTGPSSTPTRASDGAGPWSRWVHCRPPSARTAWSRPARRRRSRTGRPHCSS